MEYCHQTTDSGMICKICKVHGKPPPQARGAWVSRPISNWPKAPELLKRHQQSEWHKAAVQCQVMADITKDKGDIVQPLFKISEEQRLKNRDLLKKVIRSVYFLVKHHIPHTTNFTDLIKLQVENGDELLKIVLAMLHTFQKSA